MKRFLLILLCLSSCLLFRPEAIHAARHVSSPVNGSNIQHTTGAVETEAMKAENISGLGAKQESDTQVVHQAARPKGPSSPQSFMDTELLALLLLIMVLGMLYTNPSR